MLPLTVALLHWAHPIGRSTANYVKVGSPVKIFHFVFAIHLTSFGATSCCGGGQVYFRSRSQSFAVGLCCEYVWNYYEWLQIFLYHRHHLLYRCTEAAYFKYFHTYLSVGCMNYISTRNYLYWISFKLFLAKLFFKEAFCCWLFIYSPIMRIIKLVLECVF